PGETEPPQRPVEHHRRAGEVPRVLQHSDHQEEDEDLGDEGQEGADAGEDAVPDEVVHQAGGQQSADEGSDRKSVVKGKRVRLVSDWSSDVCSSDLPERPNHPSGRWSITAARARYPESSSTPITRKRTKIWGTKVRKAPMPAKTPSRTKSCTRPAGSSPLTKVQIGRAS